MEEVLTTRGGLTRAQARVATGALLDAMRRELRSGNVVLLTRVGSLRLVQLPGRAGHCPASGEPVVYGPSWRLRARTSRKLGGGPS